MKGPPQCLVMDRRHYKPINSGYWRLTSVWDMGNVGHDRVACVCTSVCLLTHCVVCSQSFWEINLPEDHRAWFRIFRFGMLINTYVCMLLCTSGTKENKEVKPQHCVSQKVEKQAGKLKVEDVICKNCSCKRECFESVSPSKQTAYKKNCKTCSYIWIFEKTCRYTGFFFST